MQSEKLKQHKWTSCGQAVDKAENKRILSDLVHTEDRLGLRDRDRFRLERDRLALLNRVRLLNLLNRDRLTDELELMRLVLLVQ